MVSYKPYVYICYYGIVLLNFYVISVFCVVSIPTLSQLSRRQSRKNRLTKQKIDIPYNQYIRSEQTYLLTGQNHSFVSRVMKRQNSLTHLLCDLEKRNEFGPFI